MTMVNATGNWMRNQRTRPGWVIIALVVMFGAGCTKWSGGGPKMPYEPGLYSRIFKSKPGGDSRLRKKIGVAPFQMKSRFGVPATITRFQEGLLDAVGSECPSVLFIKDGDSQYPQGIGDLPRLASGAIDNYRLAMDARQSGLFGVLTGVITSVNVDSEDKGMWFFRRTKYYIQVEALVDLYSTESATKLFNAAVSKRVAVEEVDVEFIRSQNQIGQSFIDMALQEIIEDLSGRLCYSIRSAGWKNYILSASGDGIQVATGSRSGIRVGQIFHVYDTSQTLEGYGDHRFVITGSKIGEIKVTSVSENSAWAVPVSGSGFRAGQAVGLKK